MVSRGIYCVHVSVSLGWYVSWLVSLLVLWALSRFFFKTFCMCSGPWYMFKLVVKMVVHQLHHDTVQHSELYTKKDYIRARNKCKLISYLLRTKVMHLQIL